MSLEFLNRIDMLQIIHLKVGELLLAFTLIVTNQQINYVRSLIVKDTNRKKKKIKHPINLIIELSC